MSISYFLVWKSLHYHWPLHLPPPLTAQKIPILLYIPNLSGRKNSGWLYDFIDKEFSLSLCLFLFLHSSVRYLFSLSQFVWCYKCIITQFFFVRCSSTRTQWGLPPMRNKYVVVLQESPRSVVYEAYPQKHFFLASCSSKFGQFLGVSSKCNYI